MCRLSSWALVLVVAIGCQGESGPRRYPVEGEVRINGQPAAFVRVQFHHVDSSLPGNLKIPVGMTKESGRFQLSTSGNNDGAIEGEYRVTFEWMSGNDLSAFDKLGGKFANVATTPFRVKVEPKKNILPTFELTIPEASILRRPPRGTEP